MDLEAVHAEACRQLGELMVAHSLLAARYDQALRELGEAREDLDALRQGP